MTDTLEDYVDSEGKGEANTSSRLDANLLLDADDGHVSDSTEAMETDQHVEDGTQQKETRSKTTSSTAFNTSTPDPAQTPATTTPPQQATAKEPIDTASHPVQSCSTAPYNTWAAQSQPPADVAAHIQLPAPLSKTGINASICSLDASSFGGGMARVYYTIRSMKRAQRTVQPLGGCDLTVKKIPDAGSFVNDGDMRQKIAHMRHSYTQKRNTCTSFCRSTLTCTTCTALGDHVVLHRDNTQKDTADLPPQCFVLSDQNFPAVLPAGSDGECVKIIRVEDGSLTELIDFLLEITVGFTIPAGSVAVLASASHLAAVGPEAYAADFVKAAKTVRTSFGEGIIVLHGFPVMIGGCTDPVLIGNMVDINLWVGMAASKGRDLVTTRKLFHTLMCCDTQDEPRAHQPQGDGSPSAPPQMHCENRLRLPTGLASYEKAAFLCCPRDNIKTKLDPASPDLEHRLIGSMLEELNETFSLGLSYTVSFDRLIEESDSDNDTGDETETAPHRFIVLGGKHATKIAETLSSCGHNVADLSCSTWKVTESLIEEHTALLVETLAEEPDTRTTIIYMLFDNNIFMVHGPGGTRSLPRKLQDDVEHVEGELHIADKKATKELFNIITPLLRAGGAHEKVLLAPLVRYIVGPCCDAKTHVTNMREPNYVKGIVHGIRQIKDMLLELAHSKRIRNVAAVLPSDLLRPDPALNQDVMEVYGTDPVMVKDAGYLQLTKKLLDKIEGEDFYKLKETPKPVPKLRLRPDPAAARQSWVTDNDATATRHQSSSRYI